MHLALLSATAGRNAASLEADYCPPQGLIDVHKAVDRARWLGERPSGPGRGELGYARSAMVEWLMRICTAGPDAGAAGAYFDLWSAPGSPNAVTEVASERRLNE